MAQRGNQLPAGLPGTDDFVDEAARGGNIGIRELLPELVDALGARLHRIAGLLDLGYQLGAAARIPGRQEAGRRAIPASARR